MNKEVNGPYYRSLDTFKKAQRVQNPLGLLVLSHSLERYHLAPALLRRIRRLRFRFGRSRFHEAADFLRRTSLHIVGDVRIGVEGEPGAVVAQHAGQRLHIHAAG